ncbi:hypothetical protein CBER1_02301 [Cercospora berteroae]|uniref:Uncharacterized protein n=1 Tax=Cercospora berteroae TaxID=357750 RepID=A0A2S6CM54_9PEZI|nr:hypothetical protein CBER1_02301 [Cercospora berteroae]
MLSHVLVSLLLAVAAAAAPAQIDPAVIEGLTPGDLLLTEGELAGQILNATAWKDLLAAEGILLETPEVDHDYLNFTTPEAVEASAEPSLEKRQCSKTTSIITDKTERFVDWDVQMSPIVCGSGGPMDVTVTSGFSVANAVAVQGSGSPTFIAGRLSATFGVSFTRTWTTQYSVATKVTINDGECGVIVTNPLTTRRYGRTMEGCPGSFRQIGTWMADDHGTGSYAGVDWISGAITTCRKKQRWAPMTRCHGEGEFK